MTVIIDGTAGITFPVTAGSASAVQASSGRVLQVVQTSSSTVVTNTGTVSSLLSLSITPSSSSNKVLILTSLACYMNPSANALGSSVIYRGTTSGTSLQTLFGGNLTAASCYNTFSHNYLDSPSTTSAQTYTLAINKGSGGTTSQITENLYSLILMEIAA